MNGEAISAVIAFVKALDDLGIPYFITGSLASSLYGTPRSTNDVDVVAPILVKHAAAMTRVLSKEFYIDEQMIAEAVARRSTFNLIHLATMVKIDVYGLDGMPFDREALARSRLDRLGEDDQQLRVASAEDILLSKLHWFRQGGETSERQWGDIIGVLRVQGDALDGAYLRRWAHISGFTDLLDRALRAVSS